MIYGYRCSQCAAAREIVASVDHCYDLIKCPCGAWMDRELTAPMVTPDIAPYQAMAGDKLGQVIGSRRAHREFLKRNRLIEVGDAPVRDTSKMRSTVKKGEIREELKRVVPDVLKRRKA